MASSQRRFPRVPSSQPGELEVRGTGAGAAPAVRIPMTIRSLSCEGVGLVLSAHSDEIKLNRGAPVTVRLNVGRDALEIPGRVAWANRGSEEAVPIDLGVRLQLELARAKARQAYATWVVGLITQARTSAGAKP